jgi:hypothetical protein
MGQKVNPHGARIGIIFDWSSRWFVAGAKCSINKLKRIVSKRIPRKKIRTLKRMLFDSLLYRYGKLAYRLCIPP